MVAAGRVVDAGDGGATGPGGGGWRPGRDSDVLSWSSDAGDDDVERQEAAVAGGDWPRIWIQFSLSLAKQYTVVFMLQCVCIYASSIEKIKIYFDPY